MLGAERDVDGTGRSSLLDSTSMSFGYQGTPNGDLQTANCLQTM